MAKYLVNTRSFIDNRLVDEGTEIEFTGTPSDNLTPIDTAAKKAAAKSDASAVNDQLRQSAAAAGADVSDPAQVAAAQALQATENATAAQAALDAANAAVAAAAAQTAAADAATANALV